MESFEADIDHDDIPELFITSRRLTGNAGGPYLVFRRAGSKFFYIGDMGMNMHPQAFRVLPVGPDGRPRVITYWRHGGGEGTLAVLTHDGRRFQTVSSEIIHPGDSGTDEGRWKYEAAFGKENH